MLRCSWEQQTPLSESTETHTMTLRTVKADLLLSHWCRAVSETPQYFLLLGAFLSSASSSWSSHPLWSRGLTIPGTAVPKSSVSNRTKSIFLISREAVTGGSNRNSLPLEQWVFFCFGAQFEASDTKCSSHSLFPSLFSTQVIIQAAFSGTGWRRF